LLLEAVKSGQRFRIKYLLRRLEADVDHVYEDELIALHFAAWCGDVDCVKVLVEEGADANAVSSKLGTSLCVAAFRNHDDVVELLDSTYKADVRADGGWLGSALHAACLRNDRIGFTIVHPTQRI
jgi:ankyrin repeat protein